MDFDQVLKEVLWRLVTEGGISYRRIKLNFGLDDNGLEELRRELIGLKRLAADVDGELLVWAPDGRAARPEPMALPQPLPALRYAEKPTAPAAKRDLPAVAEGAPPPVSPTAVVPAAPADGTVPADRPRSRAPAARTRAAGRRDGLRRVLTPATLAR